MADFNTCFAWLMTSEDPTYSYKATPDAPPGAFAISGINSKAFPIEFQTIAAIPQANRALAVQHFYEWNFWNEWLAQLQSNEVAKRVFDCAVNEGPGHAVKLLQMAVAQLIGVQDGIDGHWGPVTLQRANNCKPDMLAAGFRQVRAQAYRDIVTSNQADAKYLDGWLARAAK